jgi:phosphoribosyl-ATP pyrophosphohydrolase/phosphoribosyl-AMP cyclohydrolase
MQVLRPNFEKRGGLVDVVVQCGITRDVIMKAKTDETGFLNTCATGIGTFFSESRNKPWVKGEESGNYLQVLDIEIDCDGDALVYVVIPKGEGRACHTDARSCFYRSVFGRALGIPAPKAGKNEELPLIESEVHELFARFAKIGPPQDVQSLLWSLSTLESRLRARAKASPSESYTRQLLDKGVAKCAKKFGEEALEAAMAAVAESDERLVAECADVVYHMLVVLISRRLSFELVEKELRRREDKSGIEEKASR